MILKLFILHSFVRKIVAIFTSNNIMRNLLSNDVNKVRCNDVLSLKRYTIQFSSHVKSEVKTRSIDTLSNTLIIHGSYQTAE